MDYRDWVKKKWFKNYTDEEMAIIMLDQIWYFPMYPKPSQEDIDYIIKYKMSYKMQYKRFNKWLPRKLRGHLRK